MHGFPSISGKAISFAISSMRLIQPPLHLPHVLRGFRETDAPCRIFACGEDILTSWRCVGLKVWILAPCMWCVDFCGSSLLIHSGHIWPLVAPGSPQKTHRVLGFDMQVAWDGPRNEDYHLSAASTGSSAGHSRYLIRVALAQWRERRIMT